MNPFKKKKAAMEAKGPQQTLQDIQQQFNQIIFKLGDLSYRKNILNKELGNIGNEVANLNKQADDLGVKAAEVRARIQEEMKAKLEEGKANEGTEATPEAV